MRSKAVLRKGQAIVESVLAVLFISLLFFALFYFSHLLTVKILLNHAAARVARARTVGLNDFICRKAARVAVLPVAGKLLWPQEEGLGRMAMIARVPLYMERNDESEAAGCMDFEYWHTLKVEPGSHSKVSMKFECLDIPAELEGEFRIELHYPDYLMAL